MPVFTIELRDGGARLHRVDDDAVGAQLEPRDMRGNGEGLGDFRAVAEMEIEPDIVRYIVEEQRRVGGVGEMRLADRWQRVNIDCDRFGRILGGRDSLGDHRGYRVADMPHLVGRQHRVDRLQHRRAVAVVHDLARRHRDNTARREIGRGVNREDARHRACRRGVDTADYPVRMVAAHHHAIGLAGIADIVGVMALAAQQHGVFGAWDRLTDREFFVEFEQSRIDVIVHRHPFAHESVRARI